jgi:hypothetical protein
LSFLFEKIFHSKAQSAAALPPIVNTTRKRTRPLCICSYASAAIDGWMKKESDEQVRLRAADPYNRYQNCGLKAARGLFATGW